MDDSEVKVRMPFISGGYYTTSIDLPREVPLNEEIWRCAQCNRTNKGLVMCECLLIQLGEEQRDDSIHELGGEG